MASEANNNQADDIRAVRGNPSLVWRSGQNRRLRLIQQWLRLEGATILVDGCGVGMYVRALQPLASQVYALDIELERVREAQEQVPAARFVTAAAEALPYADESFDGVLSHEVVEHVADDRQTMSEVIRVLRPDGRLILFCPNRLYPFETHGHYWRGRYHFGNTPLINWLPDGFRNRLAPHVRAYTKRGLLALFRGLPVRIVYHSIVYPGYDNIAARHPSAAKIIRLITYAAEHTPLRYFGLSHLLVIEKQAR